MFDVLRDNPLAQHTALEGWIQRDVAVALFNRARLNFEDLKSRARTRGFQPVMLPNVKFSASYAVKKEQVVSKNVVGVLTGKGHPDEWVLYTSHWDHLGTDPHATGDGIYNGAVDNAAGTAQVLEIARAFAKAKRTDRSIAFLFVTAEEKGLLGSEYYATHPLYPLAKTVADLNSDAPKPASPAKNFSTAGDGALTLQDMLVEEGRKFGRTFSPDARPEAGSFFRSDHFSFAKQGVPAISFKSGEDLNEGGLEAGKAGSEAYTTERYHQPGDEIDDSWRSDGIAADAVLLYTLGRRLADSREWPEWKAGSEFKQAREASAAERQ
jgi:Zn-dependent M28 family amino/carboxypeptidase